MDMNPILLSHEEFLRSFMYDYMQQRSNNSTTTPALPAAEQQDGMYTSQEQMPASSTHVPVLENAPLMLREQYAPQLLGGFPIHKELFVCDFSSDGRIVASGGLDGKVVLCYMDTFDSVTDSQAHSDSITDIRFEPGSTRFMTSSIDKTVKIWDAAKPGIEVRKLAPHQGWVRSLDFHPTEEILALSHSSDIIELWSVNQNTRIKRFMVGGKRVRFQPGLGRFLAVANGKSINILDTQTSSAQIRSLQGHLNDVLCICWDTTGLMIASVSEDSARVWSVSMSSRHCLYAISSNGMRFQSIVYHPRYCNVLLIGGYQCMKLWIADSGRSFSIPVTNVLTTGLAASTQNELIASACSDCGVKIWK